METLITPHVDTRYVSALCLGSWGEVLAVLSLVKKSQAVSYLLGLFFFFFFLFFFFFKLPLSLLSFWAREQIYATVVTYAAAVLIL